MSESDSLTGTVCMADWDRDFMIEDKIYQFRDRIETAGRGDERRGVKGIIYWNGDAIYKTEPREKVADFGMLPFPIRYGEANR